MKFFHIHGYTNSGELVTVSVDLDKLRTALASHDDANPEADEFVCVRCGNVRDIEDSVQTEDGLVCSGCSHDPYVGDPHAEQESNYREITT